MKISYISRAEIPSKTANSIHIVKMCNALAAEHNVTLFADFKNKDFKVLQEFYGFQNTFSIRHLKAYKIKYFSHLEGFVMACKAIFNNADLVIGRHISGCLFSALFGIPTVYESHAPIIDSGKLTDKLFRRLIKCRSFKKLIVITNSLKEYFIKTHPELETKIIVLPDAADEVDLNLVKSKGIRIKDKLNVGYTGHLYSGKGMEIISELVKECDFSHFHIVGGKENDIKYWKEKLKDYHNINFYGFKKHSEIPSFLKDFDVVLLPNQEEVMSNNNRNIGQWTSPLKLFEYMAAGKAIVASDIPVLNEILTNGVNSYTCSPDNINQWKEILKELYTNNEKREIIGQRAVNDFLSHYSWKKRTIKLLNALN